MSAFRDRYFRQTTKLRWCLHQANVDQQYADGGGRIVYLMDANIIRFFVNPERDQHLSAAFTPGHARDPGTALVTAEYLFSKQLPGQQATPAFIAPAHGDDLQEVIAAIGSDTPADTSSFRFDENHISSHPPVPAPDDLHANSLRDEEFPQRRYQNYSPEQLRALLQALLEDVRSHRVSREDAIERLQGIVPELAHDLIAGGFQEALQLVRLFNEDLLRPLSLHTLATRDVMEVSRDKGIKQWCDRLEAEHDARERWRPEFRARLRDNPQGRKHKARQRIMRDAEVILQTMRLNENARNSADELRYVLVSADQVLIDAYARWFWELQPSERADHDFMVRDLLQYSPLLHTQDELLVAASSDLTEQVTSALDSLFVSRAEFSEGYPEKLLFHRLRPLIHNQPPGTQEHDSNFRSMTIDPRTMDQFQHTSDYWAESLRSGVVLNANLIRRRLTKEFDHVAELLRQDRDLVDGFREIQKRAIESVNVIHVAVAARGSLRPLAARLKERPIVERRSALVFHPERFRGLLGSESLETVLDRLAEDNGDAWHKLEERMNRASSDDRYLLSACIAHRLYGWDTARRFVEWLLNSSDTNLLDIRRRDMVYLHAVVSRMELSSTQSLQKSLMQLRQLAKVSHDNHDIFGAARALCEQCSLILALTLHAQLRIGKQIELLAQELLSAEPPFEDLLSDLLEATEVAGDSYVELRAQTIANLLRYYACSSLPTPVEGLFRKRADHSITDYAERLCSGGDIPWLTDAQRAEWAFMQYRLGHITLAVLCSTIERLKNGSEPGRSGLEECELQTFARHLYE